MKSGIQRGGGLGIVRTTEDRMNGSDKEFESVVSPWIQETMLVAQ